jgi:hypothetical protein
MRPASRLHLVVAFFALVALIGVGLAPANTVA